MFYKLFRQPYLDIDDGNLGGGEPSIEPNNPAEPVEPNPQPNGTEPVQEQQQTIKVKYNHQEMELPYEEAVAHIQKGMNYDKAIERTRQEAAQAARDAYIAEQGYEWNGKPITTEAEYKQALKEKEIYEKYQAQGLPDEVVQELIESKRFREQFEKEKQSKTEQERKQAEYIEFLDVYKKKNGKQFDPDNDVIAPEILEMVNKGKTLADAYSIWHGDSKDARIAELEARLKAIETNTQNANSSPGSVTGNGNADPDFISAETYESNRKNPDWVKQNFKKIMSSRTKW